MVEYIAFVKAGGSSGLTEKFVTLGIIAFFAMIVYAIMPKMLDKKIREYHGQCEIEEEEESGRDEKAKEIRQGVKNK